MAMSAIAAVVLILVFILREAAPLFVDELALEAQGGLSSLVRARTWEGYDAPEHVWQPVGFPGKLNILPLFAGTLKITLLTMLLSVPVGLGGAIFLAEYAPRRLREVVKPAVELLASVPSVVVGFFALAVLAGGLQRLVDATYRLNATVAALGLAFAVVPVVVTISEDALRAVPRDLVEASLALGARRWQTTLGVTLPAALPGIAAAIVLGFGRAVGETMIVLMASGNAPVLDASPLSSARTVTATIAAELGEVTPGDDHWRVLFLLGGLLFVVTVGLNEAGRFAVGRLRRRLRAEGVT
ncbi:MAG: phosphate ABC transporter permease subunit PstC [Myxococcales bacterium]|nr:phosphate ABC transporter permease subunit PstC [Myxococcales bacterium]